jgi:hypothetical protein
VTSQFVLMAGKQKDRFLKLWAAHVHEMQGFSDRAMSERYVPPAKNSCSIGEGARAETNATAIGVSAVALEGGIAIGNGVVAGPNELVIGVWRITKLFERIDELERRVVEQDEMLKALWFHPGMPGYEEGRSAFEEHKVLL